MSDPAHEPTAREPRADLRTVMLTFGGDGNEQAFECIDNDHSVRMARHVLQGESYPSLPGVRPVRIVMDVGANCGAASVHFSRQFPDARILAFEPAADPYTVLSRNARRSPNIEPFNIGLFDRDGEVPLYHGTASSGTASLLRRPETTDVFETITVKNVERWLVEHEVNTVDILKVDTEGCEVPILNTMRDSLGDVQIVYLEYHDEHDRRTIDDLLVDTHFLAVARIFFGQGVLVYLSNDYAENAFQPIN